jgi:hypothetical protein
MVMELDLLKEIVNNMLIEYDRLKCGRIEMKTKNISLKLIKCDLDTDIFVFIEGILLSVAQEQLLSARASALSSLRDHTQTHQAW